MLSRKSGKASKRTMKTWLDSFLSHRPLLFRVIGRIVRPDEIEDIVQETFVHSYAAAHRQKIDNPRAFMVKTARNLALNHVTRAERRLCGPLEDLAALEAGGFTDSVQEQYQSEERFLAFCRAVAELPVCCRRAFILKKVYGLSQKEIADHLEISPSTVEKHIAKGMAMTARYMIECGHMEEAAAPADSFYPDEVHSN